MRTRCASTTPTVSSCRLRCFCIPLAFSLNHCARLCISSLELQCAAVRVLLSCQRSVFAHHTRRVGGLNYQVKLRDAALLFIETTVQLTRAWQAECRAGGTQRRGNTPLCTEEPAAFRKRLLGHVAAVREWGFDAADVGVLAARDIFLIAGEPRALASRIGALASFLDAVPNRSADAMLSKAERASRAQVRHLVLHGPPRSLYMSTADLKKLVANYVRLGLFATQEAARQDCLCRPSLVKTTSWQVLVRRIAAVRAMGGAAEDELTAAQGNQSAERVLEAGKLRDYSGCAALLGVASGFSGFGMTKLLDALGDSADLAPCLSCRLACSATGLS
jgi:hypothetical protein